MISFVMVAVIANAFVKAMMFIFTDCIQAEQPEGEKGGSRG